jgi:hypothetical protein
MLFVKWGMTLESIQEIDSRLATVEDQIRVFRIKPRIADADAGMGVSRKRLGGEVESGDSPRSREPAHRPKVPDPETIPPALNPPPEHLTIQEGRSNYSPPGDLASTGVLKQSHHISCETKKEKNFLNYLGTWRLDVMKKQRCFTEESAVVRRHRLLLNYKKSIKIRKKWGEIDPIEIEKYVDSLIGRRINASTQPSRNSRERMPVHPDLQAGAKF